MKKLLLDINGLSKTFSVGGKPLLAVDQVDLQLYEGEVLGLVGESGSGKSTLGQLVLGLHDKTAGSVSFDGRTLPQRYKRADFQQQAREMQMIFQDPSACLNPRLTVAELVAEPLLLINNGTPLTVSERRQQVLESLARVNLPASAMGRYAHEFSGGQRQRIGIARALIVQPRLLICDEPISALDVSVQAQVVNLLADLRRKMGLSLLFIAHDLSMVRYISDRIAVMYLGQLMELADTERLFTACLHPYTYLLLASNPTMNTASRLSTPATSSVNLDTGLAVAGSGCVFAPRCAYASERCRLEKPMLQEQTTGHWLACHHPINSNS